MPVESTGAEFKAFWQDTSWSEPYGFVEDECVYVGEKTDKSEPLDSHKVDYLAVIQDTDKVTLVGGYSHRYSERPIPLEPIFLSWLDHHRNGSTTSMVVTVPTDKVDLVRIALSTIPGVKIG